MTEILMIYLAGALMMSLFVVWIQDESFVDLLPIIFWPFTLIVLIAFSIIRIYNRLIR